MGQQLPLHQQLCGTHTTNTHSCLNKHNFPATTGTSMNIPSTDAALILHFTAILIPQYPRGVVYLGGFSFALFFFKNTVKNNITIDKCLATDPFPSPKIMTGHTKNNGICTDNFLPFLLIFTHFFRETKFPCCGKNRIQ